MATDDFSKASTASSPPVGDEALPCPMCGYDLRATVSERCSECGWVIDRELLSSSSIPWAHRRQIGRIRAYCKTVWMVSIGSRKLRYEAARPQEPSDARRFRWVTAGIVATATVGAFFMFADPSAPGFFALPPLDMSQEPALSRWLITDVAMPWSAGATLWPVLPGCLALLAIYLTGVPRATFHLQGEPVLARQRAQCVALYTGAPLAMLLPVGIYTFLAALCGALPDFERSQTPTDRLVVLLSVLVLLGAVILAALQRPARWATLAVHRGLLCGLGRFVELGFLWLVGLVVILGIVPWAIGFLWVVIESLG